MTMTTPLRPPKDGIRAMPPGTVVEDGEGRTLTGRLATGWAEIDSASEGHFMERFAPGAFRKTFAENRANIKILFQHGRDPELGNKPIAALQDVGEDADGAYYRADLLDGIPPLILDGLRRGLYGSSHTFRVIREEWLDRPKKSAFNPKALPERTVKEAHVWEFGPVTWPSYAGTDTLARSLSDEFGLEALTADAARLRELVAYIEPAAPSADAGASPHLEPERRETVAPPTIPTPERKPTLDQYVTREEKASRVTELKASLTRQAVEFPGVLPADAQTTWDQDTAELEALERDIAAWDSRQVRLRAYAEDPNKVERSYEPVATFGRKSESDIYDVGAIWNRSRSPEQRDQYLRDNAMRAVEVASFPHPAADVDGARANIARLLDHNDSADKELARRILTTGSPVYRRFFNKYVTGGTMTAEESRAPLEVHVTTTGGFAVPFAFDPTIVATGAWTTVNPYRAACRVETIVGSNEWRGVSAGAVTAAYGAEAAITADSAPAFLQPAYITQRATSLVQYSVEMGQDRPDLPSEMARLISEAKDTLEEAQFAVGVGTTVYPRGMLPPHGTASMYTHIDTIGHVSIEAADLYAMEAALPIRHRANGAFFMCRAAIRAFGAYETDHGDLFGGQYYARSGPIAQSPVGNTGLRLLGYPLYESPSAPYALVDNTMIAWFGDPKSYVIVDRAGLNVEVIPHLFDATGQPFGMRGLYALWRNFAAPFNVDAGRLLAIL
jgi:HK97 family phage major capsid protein/HK97 family phage prohead protease